MKTLKRTNNRYREQKYDTDDFRNHLVVKSETKYEFGFGGKKSISHHRNYQRIALNGGFTLSVQASEFHYCNPKETVEPHTYRSFEFAIFKKDKWFSHHKSKKFNDKLKELEIYDEGNPSYPVFGYIETGKLQKLIDWIQAAYK